MRRSWIGGFLAGIVLTAFLVTAIGAAFLGTNIHQLTRMFKVAALVKSESLNDVTNQMLIEGMMKGLVGSLKDPYSVYMEPKDYQELEAHMEGSYGGVGIYVGMRDENRLTVVSPIKGTPASKSGIQAGDIIMKIDEVETLDMDMDTAVSMMKGEPGTSVTLSIFREGNHQLLSFEIVREIINIPSVDGEILENEPEIAYVDIATFSYTTTKDLAHLLAELQKENYKGIILDLRNNGGGSLQTAIEVAEFFVPPGPIVHIVDSRSTETITSTKTPLEVPLVVLVNGGSASASEILAGAIKDRDAGTLVGTKTFGKGLVQTIYQLSGGTALKLTTAKYLTPEMIDINETGIEPDVAVELNLETEEDEQLQQAIEILKQAIN
ncbi:MAG: S41 family peptidase [Bacillota bacterium]|nr:S41 family peptidase [Bacillota bacterium]